MRLAAVFVEPNEELVGFDERALSNREFSDDATGRVLDPAHIGLHNQNTRRDDGS